MIRIAFLALAASIISADSNLKISAPAGPSSIVMQTSDYTAGAFSSLTWGGKEFLDCKDHGRCLQSAASFDGLGETFNPTEAGASQFTDGLNPHASSSKLLFSQESSNALTTETQMAYWMPYNGAALSGHILTKHVQIGLPGMPHVIQYLTQFEIPAGEQHTQATFEVLTAYLKPEFARFYGFESSAGQDGDHHWRTSNALFLNDGPGEQPEPIIFATQDAQYAMAIYSPDSPQPTYQDAGYGRWRFVDCVKWNNVFRIANPVGTYRFRSYIAVGTLQDVMDAIVKLKAQFSTKGTSA